ncbi:hypothetical protein TNCV_2520101 [Trichonephila clavipes]|uniref:Uncharacterized protein n=1 Tax=Trichonephila clavipes TaxID=2585209 RepID=A0A8X6UU01_TRICX|nr:hypothetical protein TNCV_2520101 [Trichonephila clavipes]
METESPDYNHGCTEGCRIYPEIEGLDLVSSRRLELINYPNTDDNQEMKEILRTSIDDAQKKKDALVSELQSLPPCTTFNCPGTYCNPPTQLIEEHNADESNQATNNST